MPDEVTVPPTIPPTTPPNPSPTNDNAVVELYDAVIKENQQKLRQLEEENARLRATPPTPPVAADPQKFFADPEGSVAAIIDRRMNESLSGINGYIAKQSRMENYIRIKNQIKNHPSVKPVWEHIEGALDNLASQHTGDMTVEIVGASVRNLIAEYAMQNPLKYAQLIGATSTPTPPATPPVIPPQIPPSSPPLPENQPQSKSGQRELTENERRLARERRPNLPADEAYKQYLELIGEGSFVVTPKVQGK